MRDACANQTTAMFIFRNICDGPSYYMIWFIDQSEKKT